MAEALILPITREGTPYIAVLPHGRISRPYQSYVQDDVKIHKNQA